MSQLLGLAPKMSCAILSTLYAGPMNDHVGQSPQPSPLHLMEWEMNRKCALIVGLFVRMLGCCYDHHPPISSHED